MNNSQPRSVGINVCSSLFMFSNVVHLYFKRDFVYFMSFLLLLCSSLIFHSTHNEWISILDKIFVYNVIFQGGVRVFRNYKKSVLWTFLSVFTFLGVCFLYMGGYFYNDFCFNEDTDLANKYHALVHLLGSLGHNTITQLL